MEKVLNDDDDEVGYQKPPRQHRFQKGKSGNPNGRPRKIRPDPARETLGDVLKRVGNEEVEVQGRTMTLRELEIRALQHKAAKGDVQAAKHLAYLRKESGLLTRSAGGGVLVVPAAVPLDQWEAAAARQQAKYRGEDPEGLARLEAGPTGGKSTGEQGDD